MQPNVKHQKVLYVITKANWGGAQRYVYDLATNLPSEEFEVAVAFGQPGLLALKLKKAGIKTHALASLKRDMSGTTDLKSFGELLHLFRAEKPDIVHLNSSKAGGLGALAARMAGVPHIIFTAHGWPFWEKRNVVARALIWLFSWLTALLSHKVIVVSNYDHGVTGYMPFVRKKVTRIYNGISPLTLTSAAVIRDMFPTGVYITGTVGELTKNKNQIALIEEAKRNPNMHVAIVGDGEDRPYLQRKIDEYNLNARVKLCGFMPPEGVLGGFDEFVLPSLKEGLPYVLIEAKMAGLPIRANRVGGVGEILDAQDMTKFSLGRMIEQTLKLYRNP